MSLLKELNPPSPKRKKNVEFQEGQMSYLTPGKPPSRHRHPLPAGTVAWGTFTACDHSDNPMSAKQACSPRYAKIRSSSRGPAPPGASSVQGFPWGRRPASATAHEADCPILQTGDRTADETHTARHPARRPRSPCLGGVPGTCSPVQIRVLTQVAGTKVQGPSLTPVPCSDAPHGRWAP